MSGRSFRNDYTDAIWSPNALKPNERLIALAYAKYAGADKQYAENVAWVPWVNIAAMTGIRSRDAIHRAITGLTQAGWLKKLHPAKQHRAPVYQLTIPPNPGVRHTYAYTTQDTPTQEYA